MGQTNRSTVDTQEKVPTRQPIGQITPSVGDDFVASLIRQGKSETQKNAERMATQIFQPDLDLPSMAKESTKTKYGAGQLTKSPSGHYLGQASL